MIKWEVTFWSNHSLDKSFDTHKEAREYVEALGYEAEMIKWWKERNLPNLMPHWVYKSLSLYTYDGSKWHHHYIHGPEPVHEIPVDWSTA